MSQQVRAIGTKGMACLLINQILVKLFIGQARLMATWVGNAAWILYIAGMVMQGVVFFATAYFYQGAEDMDPIDMAEITFGSVGRSIIGIAFFLYFLLSFATLFRLYAETLKTVLFSESPIWIVVFLLMICIGISSHAGLSALSDLHSLFVPVSLGILCIVVIMNIGNIDIYNIFPLWGKGFQSMGRHLPMTMGATSEISMLYFLLPFANRKPFPKKAGLIALGIGGAVSLIMIFMYCLVVDYPESTEYLLSMYQLTRLAHIGASLNRLEDITEFFWIIFVVLALAFKLWIAAHVFQKTCGLPDKKPFVWSLGFLGIGISFIPVSINEVENMYSHYFVNGIRWEISFLPLVIAICYQIKQRIKGNSLCKKN